MSPTTYYLHRGVNQPMEYRGLTGPYILYLGAGLVGLILVVAILHVAGLSVYGCVAAALIMATGLIGTVYSLHKKYGQHGMARKKTAARIPDLIRVRSRTMYMA